MAHHGPLPPACWLLPAQKNHPAPPQVAGAPDGNDQKKKQKNSSTIGVFYAAYILPKDGCGVMSEDAAMALI